MAKGDPKPEEKVGAGAWEIPFPEDAEFGGLPPGTYLSVCDQEPKETLSSKQEPQTEFHYVIKDPEYPEYEGRSGSMWCSRKPKSWWLITQTLDAMAVPYEIDKAARIFRFDPMDCVNKPCKTHWEESEWQGRVRSRITRVVSLSEEVESLEGAEEAPF